MTDIRQKAVYLKFPNVDICLKGCCDLWQSLGITRSVAFKSWNRPSHKLTCVTIYDLQVNRQDVILFVDFVSILSWACFENWMYFHYELKTSIGPIRANLNCWLFLTSKWMPHHLAWGWNQIRFCVWNTRWWTKSRNPVILSAVSHCRNQLEFMCVHKDVIEQVLLPCGITCTTNVWWMIL